jgi:hypothetical protein
MSGVWLSIREPRLSILSGDNHARIGIDVCLELTSVCIVDAKVGKVPRNKFASRVRQLVTDHALLERIPETKGGIADPIQQTRQCRPSDCSLRQSLPPAHDRTKRRSVGGHTYKSTIDDPHRIKNSKAAGPLFGLTHGKYQSGATDVTGGITRAGDEMVRTALYESANVLLSHDRRFSALKRWGVAVAKRRGLK